MIIYKTEEEIELIRKSALLVTATLAEVAKFLKPGITTLQIDAHAEKFIKDNGAIPSFKNYRGFPNTCCISVNEAIVHGIPNNYALKDGDIISVDCGVYMNGYHGDSAYTFAIGNVTQEVLNLLTDTKASLYKGIAMAVPGNRIGDIAYAIQHYTETERHYGVVRELVGHGLGQHLHEDPQVPNYGKRGHGTMLKERLVIAIEPMINLGTKNVRYLDDGWTIITKDRKPSAHYEHNVVIRKREPELLSSFAEIEEAEKNNIELNASYNN